MKKLIIFTDIGDTIIDEETELRDDEGIVTSAGCLRGAKETMLRLYEAGYTIVMVADGYTKSFRNTMTLNGLDHIFSAWITSEDVGVCKPDGRMFRAAFDALGLTEADKARIIMVGNNVERDIKGANRFGITSVHMSMSHRHKWQPEEKDEYPDHEIKQPSELYELCEKLNSQL